MPKETAPPFSIRLTEEERAALKEEAGHLPLGTFLRMKLLETPSPRKRSYRQPVKNEKILAQLLAEFGKSRVKNNLNQLAKASHSGSLPVTQETEQEILRACAEVHEIRNCLLSALGIRGNKE